MTTFAPTAEQIVALDLFGKGLSLAIEAGAGAGKTSTLKLLAESTSRRGQYVAFNKAIVEEAKRKMPATVTASTAHSLAMRNFGHAYRARLDRSARMRSDDVAARLGIQPLNLVTQDGEPKHLKPGTLAGLAQRAVVRFCQTADPEPTVAHVPYVKGIDIPPGAFTNNLIVRDHIIGAVLAIWQDACDVDGTLPYKHDYYLKGWQLSGPRIHADYILFDEAQDANPVMVDIVAQQTHAQLVWVGDSQQQIYSFTGAVNALASVPSESKAYLTQSFRFGPQIAAVANQALDALDAELRIVGSGSPGTVTAIPEPDAVLTRTNAMAVSTVLQERSAGRRPHLVGGGVEVVKFAKGAQLLMDGRRSDHPDLACFDNWAEVVEYVAQDEQGDELKLMVKLIDEFGVATILSALERMPREQDADVVVSTAHKAKGREWDRVKLAGDFPTTAQDEELRLLYVAVTRARLSLDIDAVGWFDGREPFDGYDSNVAAGLPPDGDILGSEPGEPLVDGTTGEPVPWMPVGLDADHDAAGHDHASCPTCIAEAREAEHEAEGAHSAPAASPSLAQHLAGVPGDFSVYTDTNETPVWRGVRSGLAISRASEEWRTGRHSRVFVLDNQTGEAVVVYDA